MAAELYDGTISDRIHPLKIFDAAKSQDRFLNVSAPMVRYSKLAFRQTVHEYGTDLCWTPMILSKEFNRNNFARDSDLTISTQGVQPPTIVQFGSNSPIELARSSSLAAPYVNGVDLNCGCPQSWACAETLGAALMEKRELVRDMVIETRQRLANDGWHVGKERDIDSPKGRSVSVKIRVHKDLRRTMDFIDTVIGNLHDRNIDFLTIHPRTRHTASSTPINTESLGILLEKYGDTLPILLSGDVFSMATLSLSTVSKTVSESNEQVANGLTPFTPSGTKLAGLMSARGILANPAMYAGYEACPWEAVESFMRHVIRAPIPVKLVQHHLHEMVGPGMGPDKKALLDKQERAALQRLDSMIDVIDFMDDAINRKTGRTDGLRREPVDSSKLSIP
ncbi:tRNA-dihydrouridine(20a/20b) synthase [NAD(P)+]-like [Colletotrichum fructicola]|nr:tRNA-dihydrouridine(20a/20b) synthase [NAD(P)+]-like [Colletotrichum fructicola]KAF4909915.1 tRNA-dihydrouridine(20a/20b) synthase [NAD(P)+]-like [Colletotrichum fructicola]KAF4933899.1 tRNA-dihydrouridine(20a/20b) synthase [NAD(P)+]-like [Colletotrichum fructicola]KAF5513945.1 tRNA-dihydrouridine(20a/20b) synthase [NAD(P)+]-like [Colletotrichum fructicola]